MTTSRRSRGSSRGGRRSGPRLRTTWEQITTGFVVTALASQTLVDITHLSMGGNRLQGGRLLRLIMELKCENAGTADDHLNAAWGITTVTQDAFAGGVVPDPLLDISHSWYYWRVVDAHIQAVAVDGDAKPWVEHFDFKTGPRIKVQDRLVIIFDKMTSVEAFNIVINGRALWQLAQ